MNFFFEFGDYIKNSDKTVLDLLLVPDNYGPLFFNKMLQNVKTKNGILYVLEIDKKVCGFIAGVIFDAGIKNNELDCKPHRMGRVADLFVTECYRGLGYGSKMLGKMEKYFKMKKCFKVNIEVFAPNVDAYYFYKKHKYQDRNIDLVKKL